MSNIIVLFEATIKEGKLKDYIDKAASLKEQLLTFDGFISSERFESLNTDRKILSKSQWRDEISVKKWRNLTEHRLYQQQGRENYFENYKITVVSPLRTYTMDLRKEAPLDSNNFFNI